MVEELEGVLVRKLDDGILERADLLEHLVRDLGVQTDRAVLELVERRVESLVDADELLLEPLELALVLELRFFQASDLVGKLVEISLTPLHIFLPLHQEDLLLLVVLLDGFGERVLPVL